MKNIDKKELQRFENFIKNEPIVSILHRNMSFLLDKDKRISSIEINSNMSSYTDGKRVVVSGMPMFLGEEFDRRHWLVLLRVNLAHEIQHDNSSDFLLVKQLRTWYGDYLYDNFGINKRIGTDFAQYTINCVEDGRINEIIVQRFPGYLSMMRWVNYGIRDYNKIESVATTAKEELSHFTGQMLSYAKTGLDVPGLELYAGTEMEREFQKIKNFIDEGVASPTARGCYNACVKILETIAPYIAKLSKLDSAIMDFIESLHLENYSQSENDREEQTGNNSAGQTVRSNSQQEDPQDKEKGEGKGDEKEEQNQSNQSSDGSRKEGEAEKNESPNDSNSNNKTNSKDDSEDDSKEDKSSSKHKSPKASQESALKRAEKKGPKSIGEVIGVDETSGESSCLTPEEIEEMLKTSESDLCKESAFEKENTVEMGSRTPLSKKDQGTLYQKYGNVKFQEIFITPLKLALPPELKTKSNELHRTLMKVLMNQRAHISNQRRGEIATNSLWKVGINNPDIFQRKSPPKKCDCVFYELIDRSGSMGSSAYSSSGNNKRVSKLFSAISTAAVIEEALKGIAKTKVVAFDGVCNTVNHVVIKDFDQNPIGNRCFDSLTQVSASGGNMDGYSIRVATMDLVKRPEKKKILIVLSDGLPSAYRGEQEGINDVRQAVQAARRQGIIVIPIMFGMSDNTGTFNNYKEMYEKHIISTNPSNILKEFQNLLPKIIK